MTSHSLTKGLAALDLDGGKPRKDASDGTAGLAVLALLLALILGFSAVDIQRDRAVGETAASGAGAVEAPILDGRGKWGGYL